MKKILEQVLPLGVINRLKYLRSMLVLCQHAFWEKGRYFRFHGCNNRNDQVQLGAKIMLFTHEIQKGLSHTDFRYCFGSKPIHNLSNALKLWHDNNYPRTNMNYIAGIRCLRAYKEKHLNAQVELPDFFLEETKEFSNEINDLRDARSTVNVRAAEKAGNTNKKFLDLFLERSSTREYASEEPDPKDILKAVQYASKSPSMCNRQPSRVIVVSDPDTIKRALDIQGGMRGYKYPPPPSGHSCRRACISF